MKIQIFIFHHLFTSLLETRLLRLCPFWATIIATNCPYGPREIFHHRNGQLGKLIDPNSPSQMAKSIIETINIKKVPDYKVFLEKCNEENVLNNFEFIFKRISY